MGGFTSLPALMAGKKMRVRTFIHESNAYPGKSNRVASRWADIVLLGLESCRQHFPTKNVEVVGTPLRGVMREPYDRNQAIEHFNLSDEKKTLLVIGGSQGAYGINSVIIESLINLKDLGVQVIHITGPADYDRVCSLYEGVKIKSYIAPFCDHMQLAYAVCDVAIARSGASSLAELSTFGIPSILVPYPYATDDHQTLNALVYSESGAAFLKQEREMNQSELTNVLCQLFDSSHEIHGKMSSAMRKMAVIDAAEKICEQIQLNSK
jgi:UDP-N-acetylglucosamine--N-acetylmuramyl-(pentapeptide) pyrophosphoryl-undecaprenol N-acetylglucosamine transferase